MALLGHLCLYRPPWLLSCITTHRLILWMRWMLNIFRWIKVIIYNGHCLSRDYIIIRLWIFTCFCCAWKNWIYVALFVAEVVESIDWGDHRWCVGDCMIISWFSIVSTICMCKMLSLVLLQKVMVTYLLTYLLTCIYMWVLLILITFWLFRFMNKFF